MSNLFEQVPVDGEEFAINPEPRCPCLLLLDVSGSMSGAKINELNAGLAQFRDELMGDNLAAKRVEIGITTFGPVETVNDFASVPNWRAPTLATRGDTPMGAAIRHAVTALRMRKDTYRSHGISYYRPWIFLITDGAPTDDWSTAPALIREGEASKAFAFFAVGVQGADFDVLRQISVREPLALKGLEFRRLFAWLSSSLTQVSKSNPGDDVPLQNPTGPNGWASVG